nr:MAG TPA: hypothetical protein [Bacteriophage sp.]
MHCICTYHGYFFFIQIAERVICTCSFSPISPDR